MGNLKLNILTKDGKPIEARKLDPNDPEVKRLIEETIKAQEEILALKKWDAESMRQVITI